MTKYETAGFQARLRDPSTRQLPPNMSLCSYKKGQRTEWVRGWQRGDSYRHFKAHVQEDDQTSR